MNDEPYLTLQSSTLILHYPDRAKHTAMHALRLARRMQSGMRLHTSGCGGGGGVSLDSVRIRGQCQEGLARSWANAGFLVEDGRRVVVGAVVFELVGGAPETTLDCVDLLN